MPKTKAASPKDKKVDPLAGMLRYYDYTSAKLAKLFGTTPQTITNRLKVPLDGLSAHDFVRLIRDGVPPEEIMEALCKYV